MQKVDLIIQGTLVPMVSKEIYPDGALAISQGVIVATGSIHEIFSHYTASTILGSPHSIILPGFINGHTHVGMSLLRGVADNAKNLEEWLNDYIFPLEKRFLSEDFVYWSTLLACYEMIQSGITTFADMYFFEFAAAQAINHAGLRAILGETVFLVSDLEFAQDFCLSFQGNKTIIPALAPHSLYSCDARTLIQAHNFSQKNSTPFIIHVAEHYNEVVALYKKTGLSPAEYMQSIGILSPHVIIAHGVHFTDNDLSIIGQSGASIIYNPTSNMKLSSGIAHIKSMQEHGIAVGLGTDGAASNNGLDCFSEMKIGALLQGLCVGNYCKPLTPFEMVKLATCDGARALKMDHLVGTLELGKRADIIVVEAQEMHQLPSYDVYSQLVYASTSHDVQTVVVDGKVVMHNRKMITLFDILVPLQERIAYYQKKIKATQE